MLINFENSAVATGLGKVSFHSNPKERQCQECSKLPYNCTPLTCQYSNAENSPSQAPIVHEGELPDVQAGFRKGRGTRDQFANIHWIIEKAREFQKNIYFCFIDYAKDFVDQNKLWKILKENWGIQGGNWEFQTWSPNPHLGLSGIPRGLPDYLTCLLRNLCGSRSNS